MWKKVVGPILLMTVLWLSTSGATTVYIFWLTDSNDRILEENVSSIRAAGLMQQSVWKMHSAFLDALADDDAANREQDLRNIRDIEESFYAAVQTARHYALDPVEPALVAASFERFAEYREVIERRLKQPADANSDDADIVDQTMHLANRVAEPCAELVQINERLMNSAVDSRSRTERAYFFVRFGLLILGPALGIFVGLRIARGLHQSISQISVTLKAASGDMDHEVGNVQIIPSRDAGDLTVLNEQVQAISLRIRQVLAELNRARQEALISERLAVVGELAASVAHEIRNPLTSVKLLVQTAQGVEDGGILLEARQRQVILQEVLRMEETIQTLLDFARPPQIHRIRHDLRDTLRRALNLVEGRARLERVEIVPRFSATPMMVDGDPEQLHQVFVNLLINGIESMSQGGTLQITAEHDAEAGIYRVIVADSGAGIPPDRLAQIFEPFFTTKPRGTGLGLPVTRRIVCEHGGTIVARNRAEGGASLTVELPSAEPGAPRDAAATQPLSQRTSAELVTVMEQETV